jgi:hypothetical protein
VVMAALQRERDQRRDSGLHRRTDDDHLWRASASYDEAAWSLVGWISPRVPNLHSIGRLAYLARVSATEIQLTPQTIAICIRRVASGS